MWTEYFKLAETMTRLSFAAPQVVSHRMLRNYAPGSTADQAELTRMVSEKHAAAVESMTVMASAAPAMYQRFLLDCWTGAFFQTNLRGPASSREALKATQAALKPFERRATANARRLGKPAQKPR